MRAWTPCAPNTASMKAPPKRKGNAGTCAPVGEPEQASMKALPKKEGKCLLGARAGEIFQGASMKALPKRKGNAVPAHRRLRRLGHLNESPYEKVGNSGFPRVERQAIRCASMKVPTKGKEMVTAGL